MTAVPFRRAVDTLGGVSCDDGTIGGIHAIVTGYHDQKHHKQHHHSLDSCCPSAIVDIVLFCSGCTIQSSEFKTM
jgi:hypothetical protein